MQLLLTSLFLGHFIGDFLFQTDRCAARKSFDGATLLRHCLLYFVGMFIGVLFGLGVLPALIAAAVLAVLHGCIDFVGSLLARRRIKKSGRNTANAPAPGFSSGRQELIHFTIDQLLHVTTILLAFFVLSQTLAGQAMLMPLPEALWKIDFSSLSYFPVVLVVTLAIFCTKPALVIVRTVLRAVEVSGTKQLSASATEVGVADTNTDIDAELPHQKAGRVIGILERLLVLALGLSGNFMALGFVVAVKGLARFKQFDEKDFAEIFLVGTLTSMLLAVAAVLVGLLALR